MAAVIGLNQFLVFLIEHMRRGLRGRSTEAHVTAVTAEHFRKVFRAGRVGLGRYQR